MKKLKKNGIIIACIIFMSVILSSCSATGVTGNGENKNLIISHFLPGTHPVQTNLFVELGDRLNENSDGRISYEVYPSNALGEAGSQYDMAVTGEVDIALSVHGYTNGRFPLVRVLELPFLTESAEHGSKIITKLYEDFPEFKEEHSDTVPLWFFTADPAQIVSKNHRIENPEDMKGLRVRSPSPLANEILEQLGAVPVSMPMGDVYESMERGVIDAAVIPLESLYAYNLHEVARYVTMGNFSSTPFFCVMNKETYENLRDSERDYLNSLRGMEYAIKSGKTWDASGEKGRKLAEENGAEFIELKGELLEKWEEALKPVAQKWIDEMEQQGYPGQKIYNRALELKEEMK